MYFVLAGNKEREKDGTRTLKLKEKQAAPLICNSPRPLFLTIRIPATAGLRAVNNPCLITGGIFFFDLDGPDQLNFYHLGAINPHVLSLPSDLFYKHVKNLLTENFFIPFALTSEQAILFNYSPDRQESQIGINTFSPTHDFLTFHSTVIIFIPGHSPATCSGWFLKWSQNG